MGTLKRYRGQGVGTVTFKYAIDSLVFNAADDVTMSLDGGNTFLTVKDGFYTWRFEPTKRIVFGSGSWQIFGPAGSTNTGVWPFNPAELSGLTGWWDAYNIDGQNNATLTDQDLVYQWNDLSGNDYHMTNTTGRPPKFLEADDSGLTPTKPTIEFAKVGGLSRWLKVPSATAGFDDILPPDGKSFYVVYHHKINNGKWETPGLGTRVLGTANYPSNFSIDVGRYDDVNEYGGLEWSNLLIQNAALVDSIPITNPFVSIENSLGKKLLSFRHDGTNYVMKSVNPEFTYDEDLQTVTGTMGASNTSNDEFGVRWQFDFLDDLTTEIYEVITVAGYVDDATDAQAITYLTDKWGLGLD